MALYQKISIFVVFAFMASVCNAQNKKGIYVDPAGVIRWEKDHKEAAFFGVNYTTPFAYGYRAIKKLGISPEQAIKDDVYHFSRLGLDAFRVHVWDTEISDSLGNLINNEHLRLFDFLLAELKKRKIKTLVTPIAFWGNGYPERDVNTGSFSSKYGKQKALTNEEAFKAQENYLKQFFKHKNQYTGLTYQQDPDILATEVNNEPQHSGTMERATEYVNRMVAAIKSTGWTKPIFYNISESPKYAAAIVKANVSGHSFQWYPTGLVAGHTLQGNYLPNVAQYKIPFDTIPAFKKRAKVVYEFDAGDVMAPIMYPAMAKSFRAAGFQWATQFAYDPMATAYANTEYQTHYLNLAYTPAKAISLLIASKVFHQVARLDTLMGEHSFGAFHLDYQKMLSEMNTDEEFYYSNATTSNAKNPTKLKHIAGVGSSPMVSYQGKGAYFIDQLEAGVWRLEVMPDAIQIRDPFEKASPKKEVTQINWTNHGIAIDLADLGKEFQVKGLNEGNSYTASTANGSFSIAPGTYLLVKKNVKTKFDATSIAGNLTLGEFVAPKTSVKEAFLKHQVSGTVSENVAMPIKVEIVGLNVKDSLFIELRNSANQWKSLPLQRNSDYDFTALIPADLVKAGLLSYHIVLRRASGEYVTFPANEKGNPYDWDKLETPYYQINVAAKQALLELFNANTDGTNTNIYNPDWENKAITYSSADQPSQLHLKLSLGNSKIPLMGFQSYFGDKIKGRLTELQELKTLVIRVRSDIDRAKIKVGLIDVNANFFATEVEVGKDFKTITIPLTQLKPDSQLLLPRPYPGFLPLYYRSANPNPVFKLADAEKLEITFGYGTSNQPRSLAVETIYLK